MRTDPVVVDCALRSPPDLRTIDGLARIALAARRTGRRVLLVDADEALLGLLSLCGLARALGVEPERQPEEREQARGVEEEGDLRDPPA